MWGGGCYGMHTYILDRVIITVGDETGPCSSVYVAGHADLSVYQVISVLAFGAAVLAMLIQKVEAPEGGDGRSGPSWVGSAVPLMLSRNTT
jgi:hypothetical protein